MRLKRPTITRFSIKEGFDNLPIAVCYFNRAGLPILCNRSMDRLFSALTGRDLQYREELQSAIAALENAIYTTAEGEVWQFHEKVLPKLGTEILALNVTELYKKNLALSERQQELREMLESIEETNRNIVAIAREEEILSMKMRIHSEMGKSVLQLHKYHAGSRSAEEKQALGAQLEYAVQLLKGEVGQSDEVDALAELRETARAVGVTIHMDGRLPRDREQLQLGIAAVRECLTNCIRHALGDALFVSIRYRKDWVDVTIMNNGVAPSGPIKEGGGLGSLRRKIEKAGGSMGIVSAPRFILAVSVPQKGENG